MRVWILSAAVALVASAHATDSPQIPQYDEKVSVAADTAVSDHGAPDTKTTIRRFLNDTIVSSPGESRPAEVADEDADSPPMDIHSPSDHDRLIPLQANDVIGLTLAMIGLILAAGGGIGGGGILVPIYILILNFLPKHAIPLSNVTVFGGSIANTLLNWRKRHPVADRPLIDWDLIVVMERESLRFCVSFLQTALTPSCALTRIIENIQHQLCSER